MKQKICPICRQEFGARNHKQICCSRACAQVRARSGYLKRPKQEKHHAWKGGRFINYEGYVMISPVQHPYPRKGRYIREHIAIMEKHLGRALRKNEYVHHKNHQRDDNRLSNLEVMSPAEHTKKHREEEARARKKGINLHNGHFARKPKLPCKLCERPSRNYGLCKTHATRYRTHGDPMVVIVRGKKRRQAENVWRLH